MGALPALVYHISLLSSCTLLWIKEDTERYRICFCPVEAFCIFGRQTWLWKTSHVINMIKCWSTLSHQERDRETGIVQKDVQNDIVCLGTDEASLGGF